MSNLKVECSCTCGSKLGLSKLLEEEEVVLMTASGLQGEQPLVDRTMQIREGFTSGPPNGVLKRGGTVVSGCWWVASQRADLINLISY